MNTREREREREGERDERRIGGKPKVQMRKMLFFFKKYFFCVFVCLTKSVDVIVCWVCVKFFFSFYFILFNLIFFFFLVFGLLERGVHVMRIGGELRVIKKTKAGLVLCLEDLFLTCELDG